MKDYSNIIGNKNNKLTIIDVIPASKDNNYRIYYKCLCDCGNTTTITKHQFTSGKAKSCGCLKHHNLIHNEYKTALYKHWLCMRQRCSNPWNTSYKYYGGRGIKYVKEWDNYINFRNWSINNGYKDGLSLDRIDCNKDYSPDNCRWVDISIQGSNRRCVLYFKYKDNIYSITELSKILKVCYSTLSSNYCNNGNLNKYGCINSTYEEYINSK